MPSLTETERHRAFGGEQLQFTHQSTACQCQMTFSVFLPPAAKSTNTPVLWWLSGLTCTDQNFITKAGAQKLAAKLGIALIAPDTSPRGDGVPDDPDAAYDFGLGAGFYVNAIKQPWNTHYRMYDYIVEELPQLVAENLPLDMSRQGIFGHSMGGHGALTIALKNPGRFKSVSAFAPIVSPLNCPWGENALTGYLGDDKALWAEYDSCSLIANAPERLPILIDQGTGDNFLTDQLKPELLQAACDKVNHPLTLRMQEGYDHSYYFIASFIDDHLNWHAEAF